MKKREIIEEPKPLKPHLVLLGAGASKASFPEGDGLARELPLMDDLVEKVGLQTLLEKNGINSSGNFEIIYSQLQDGKLKDEVDKKITNYFSSLFLPETVTIYDQLLLSLRKKDVIFSFNWDPFLFDAYRRNQGVASLPSIYFLHGNVRIGSCEKCGDWGIKSNFCSSCKIQYEDVPLLFPIKKKNYFESNLYINRAWNEVKCSFSEAFTLTIFGYSAPNSDIEAIRILKEAWLLQSVREAEL